MMEEVGIDRIGKIARVSATDNDVANSFKRAHDDYNSDGSQSAFHKLLSSAIAKRQAADTEIKVSDTYILDVSRATQSLFYQNGFQNLNLSIMSQRARAAYT